VIQFVEEKRLVGVKFLNVSERKKTQLAQLIGEIEENQDSGEVEKP
jgi:c-di-GMP-binding flagellar brake protein YcgR